MTEFEREELERLMKLKRAEDSAKARQEREAFARKCKARWGLTPAQIDKILRRGESYA